MASQRAEAGPERRPSHAAPNAGVPECETVRTGRRMKANHHLAGFVLVLSALACGLPGSPPPEPTFNASLPPTPNLPPSVNQAPENPVPTVSAPIASSSSSIRDEFDSKLAPGSGWTWLRSDPSGWSLTVNPGWLRINLSTSGYLTSLPPNVLTIPAPHGDFSVSTSVRFSPTRNFELAGLIVVFDEKVVLQFGRGFCNAGDCPGDGYYFDNFQNGSAVGGNFGTPGSASQSVLRVVRQGSTYAASYQTDNTNWIQVGSHSLDLQPLFVGLIADQAPAAGPFAEFDWFVVSQP